MSDKTACSVFDDLLPIWQQGNASPETCKWIEAHLEECPACRDKIDPYRESVREHERAEQQSEKEYFRLMRRRARRPLRLAGAAAFAVILVIYLYLPLGIGEYRLSKGQLDSLMQQLAANNTHYYEEWLPEVSVADCRILGATRKGDTGTLYAWIDEGDYVSLNGKSYTMSGGSYPAKLSFTLRNDEVLLTGISLPEDGELYARSLRKLYPLRFYLRERHYERTRSGGDPKLEKDLGRKIQEALGTPLVTDEYLDIEEDGRYVIWRSVDSEDGSFETETLEQGRLEKRS